MYVICQCLQLAGTGVKISLGYPLDTDTPGFANENLTKVRAFCIHSQSLVKLKSSNTPACGVELVLPAAARDRGYNKICWRRDILA